MHVPRARASEQFSALSQSVRLVIVDQPQQRFRFRYESELGGTHGQLAGSGGTERRSYPTVKLEGWSQPAIVRCELYSTMESSSTGGLPVPHVHTLQGKNCNSQGRAEISVDAQNSHTASFQGLGIIHTAKKHMLDKIIARKLEEKRLFMQRVNTSKIWCPDESDISEAREVANRESVLINMNRVCLRFQAFVIDPKTLMPEAICNPVYSDPIYNGKSAQTGELKIVQLSHPSSPCTGNREIWLLVERVRKNDIRVRLFEENEKQQVVWCEYGRVVRCHHQYAIIFQTPSYWNLQLTKSVRVFIQLERPSDGCVSEPKPFQYTESEHKSTKRFCQVLEYPSPMADLAETAYSDASSIPARFSAATGVVPVSLPSDASSGGSTCSKTECSANGTAAGPHVPSSGEVTAQTTGVGDRSAIVGTSPLDLSTSSSLEASGRALGSETAHGLQASNSPSALVPSLTASDVHANQYLPAISTGSMSAASECSDASFRTSPCVKNSCLPDLEHHTPLALPFGRRRGVCPLRSLMQPLHLTPGVCHVRPLICMSSSLSGMHVPLSNIGSHDIELASPVTCNDNESLSPILNNHTESCDASIHSSRSVTDEKFNQVISAPLPTIPLLPSNPCYGSLYPLDSSLLGANQWLQGVHGNVYNTVHNCHGTNIDNARAIDNEGPLINRKYAVCTSAVKRFSCTSDSTEQEVNCDVTSSLNRSQRCLPGCLSSSVSYSENGWQLRDEGLPLAFPFSNHVSNLHCTENTSKLNKASLCSTSESSQVEGISRKITEEYMIGERPSACPFLVAFGSHKRFRAASSAKLSRVCDSTSGKLEEVSEFSPKCTLNRTRSEPCQSVSTTIAASSCLRDSKSLSREHSQTSLISSPTSSQHSSKLSLSDKFRVENLLLSDNCDRLKQISCRLSTEPAMSTRSVEKSATIVSAAVST